MSKYLVNIEYTLPEFAEIEIEAISEDDAKKQANDEFERLYPETLALQVVSVTLV